MNKVRTRKSKVVEIYFILYLAALILLIPEKKELTEENVQDEQINSALKLDFTLKPLKNNLDCNLILDSGKVKLISIDSTNKIYYAGDVKDVRFSFNVEDRTINQSISLNESENYTKYFSFNEFPSEQMAQFKWFPPLRDYKNKTYVVEVIAKAELIETGKVVEQTTQFTLNVEFLNDYKFEDAAEIDDSNFTDQQNQNRMFNFNPVPFSGEFSVSPVQDVKTLAMTNWERIIYANNINIKEDLLTNPKIEISGNTRGVTGTIDYEIIDENRLKIKGNAPEHGTTKVTFSLTREYDRQTITQDFTVQALMIGPAEYPNIMYPEIKYTIKPNLPLDVNTSTVALLKNEKHDTLAISNQGGQFSYKPSHRDTAAQIYLLRYINDKMVDQRYSINVSSYPPPQILSPREVSGNSKKVEIYTESKGLINGKENYVVELLISGNANGRELTGSEDIDHLDKSIIQKFLIVPKDPSKPFTFKVRAKNENGKISKEVTWPQL